MKVSRADRSRLGDWIFTVDHALLSATIIIIVIGVILSLAASPAVALRKGLPVEYFFERHVVFAALGTTILLACSFLTPPTVRHISALILAVSLAGCAAVLVFGDELNGARRWLSLYGHSVQPSEFAKPAFVVMSAWLFAEARARPDMPALPLAFALLGVFAGLLLLQPDVGQTMLITVVWCVLFFASGQPLIVAGGIGALGCAVLAGAYSVFPHVAYRIDRFLSATPDQFSQGARAIKSFSEGGFFGRGPGEGTIKTTLPDAHTDYIFAVVAEEYGAIACFALLALYGFVVMRAIGRSLDEPDAATRLSIVGLATIFGLQAFINMGVNVGLLPAKGMTLPFISAGGSSLIAISVTVGMLLALTRRRPDHESLRPRT